MKRILFIFIILMTVIYAFNRSRNEELLISDSSTFTTRPKESEVSLNEVNLVKKQKTKEKIDKDLDVPLFIKNDPKLLAKLKMMIKDNPSFLEKFKGEIKEDPFILEKMQEIMKNPEDYKARKERKIEMFLQNPKEEREEHLDELGNFFIKELNLSVDDADSLTDLESKYLQQRDHLSQIGVKNSTRQKNGLIIMQKEDLQKLKEAQEAYEDKLKEAIGPKAYSKLQIFRLN